MDFDQQLAWTGHGLLALTEFNNRLMTLGPNGVRQHVANS